MNRIVTKWILGTLIAGTLLTACTGANDETTQERPEETFSSEIDIDDVPSLDLPVEQRDSSKLWCKEHSRYEEECYLCHPELMPKVPSTIDIDDVPSLNLSEDQRDPAKLWCTEHSRYEEECYICHPELMPSPTEKPDDDPSSTGAEGDHDQHGGLTGTGDSSEVLMCNEHNLPEVECGICQSDRIADLAVGDGMKIRFASPQSISRAGVQIGLPLELSTSASREMLGQVTFNRNQLAMVTPLGSGVVTDVFVDIGDSVTAGQVIATVHSKEAAEVRSEYMQALAEEKLARQVLAREKDLHAQGISARQDLEEAQSVLTVALAAVSKLEQLLLNLGLSEEDIQHASTLNDGSSSLPVRAPISGTVIERSIVLGTAVEPGESLYTVADLSTMWMQLSLAESQLSSIRVGSNVQSRFDAYEGITFEGEIVWIAPAVDAATRMVQARVLLTNPQGLLKDGLFGTAHLTSLTDRTALAVPAEAVQEVDGRTVVFRRLEDDLYESRVVQTGGVSDANILLIAGLDPADQIVVEGSYIVKSELLKARLGAGCVDE